MLSEREQRELRDIEQMLLSDSHLSATFKRVKARGMRQGDWLSRALVVIGVVIMMFAAVAGLGGAFLQGLGLVVGGFLWAAYGPRSSARRRAARRVTRRD